MMDLSYKYAALIGMWIIYFIHHSVFSGLKVKSYFYQKWNVSAQHYRLLYSIVSSIGFLAITLYTASIKSPYLFPRGGFVKYASLMCATLGILIVKQAFKQYSFRSFLGLGKEENGELNVLGINAYVRHPLYSGTILVVFAYWLFLPNYPTLVSSSCILLYLAIGIPSEEKKLIKQYGEAYIAYKKKVPMLVPFIKSSKAE